MAQLRFKPSRTISEHFYARGDGTRVYFFDQSELETLWMDQGFQVVQNTLDRRLLVNRKRMLKMYRVWNQAKFQKPVQ
jgi:hypothetical protein